MAGWQGQSHTNFRPLFLKRPCNGASVLLVERNSAHQNMIALQDPCLLTHSLALCPSKLACRYLCNDAYPSVCLAVRHHHCIMQEESGLPEGSNDDRSSRHGFPNAAARGRNESRDGASLHGRPPVIIPVLPYSSTGRCCQAQSFSGFCTYHDGAGAALLYAADHALHIYRSAHMRSVNDPSQGRQLVKCRASDDVVVPVLSLGRYPA